VLLKKNDWLDGRQMMVSLTWCSNGMKTTLDAMDEQQPVRECEITGHRHGVLAGARAKSAMVEVVVGGTGDGSPRVGVFF
jgi:hypothetical protein